MLAKQISKHPEIFCTAEMPLAEVFKLMTEMGCDCMPVVESLTHRNLIGAVTEHDICVKLINDNLNPQRASVARVMNGKFTTVGGETPVDECAALLRLSGAGRLFVVDENGAFLGVLTVRDLESEKPSPGLETVTRDFNLNTAVTAQMRLVH